MGAEKLFDRDTFPRYTIKDWEQWEGRWELIEGIAWAMSPAPSSDHQQLNLALAMLFHAALENCKHCKAFLPIDVVINDETIVQPDLTIVCNAPTNFTRLEKVPSLVLEILSPSTATKDLHLKSGHYSSIGIPYYLIAHPQEEWIRVMVLEDGEWSIVAEGRDIIHDFDFEGCQVTIDFKDVWPTAQ